MKQTKKRARFAYTEDGQHYYIDDRPVSFEEYRLKFNLEKGNSKG